MHISYSAANASNPFSAERSSAILALSLETTTAHVELSGEVVFLLFNAYRAFLVNSIFISNTRWHVTFLCPMDISTLSSRISKVIPTSYIYFLIASTKKSYELITHLTELLK